jgi:hypothetical protein
MKKKLSLDQLKVTSFVISLDLQTYKAGEEGFDSNCCPTMPVDKCLIINSRGDESCRSFPIRCEPVGLVRESINTLTITH